MIGRRRFIGNSFSILVNRLTQSITTFVLIAAIARIRGSYELGQYLLAFNYYFIFMTLTAQGFKILFTRELSRHPEETPVYLGNGTLLQFFFSMIGYVVLVIVVFALPYSSDTSTVCYVLGLMIFPFSLWNITESIFQAQEKMYLLTLSTMPVYILRVLVIIWAMKLNYSIVFVSAIMVISEALVLLAQWGLVTRIVKPKWQVDWDFIWRTVKSAWTFLALEGIAVLNGRIQLVILSLLGGETVVGLYGGVTQLVQPFQIISNSLVGAVFPGMSKAVELGREKQRHLIESIIDMLLSVAIPFIIGLLFVGGNLLTLIYHDPSFAKATVALNLVSFGLIAGSFSQALSFLLVANNFERVNLREVIVTSILGSFISVVLISKYQLMGAALTSLITSIIGLSQYMYSVYVRLFSLRLWCILRRPLLISILMLAIFLILENITQDLITTMVAATFAYGLLVSVFGVHALGGPGVVWAKLLRKERES
jgi:O-antigen/teichoic acid export membrane protein